MNKIARGDDAQVTGEMAIHMVAAAYGASPAEVRDWSYADLVMAQAMLPALRSAR